MTKQEAVSTASDRLAAIETWTRHTCYAAIVAASFAGILATVGIYAAVEYTRAKWAVQEAGERMARQIHETGEQMGRSVASQGLPRPMPLPRR